MAAAELYVLRERMLGPTLGRQNENRKPFFRTAPGLQDDLSLGPSLMFGFQRANFRPLSPDSAISHTKAASGRVLA